VIQVSSFAELPTYPAIYAFYGGSGAGLYVAYVGIADTLRRRVSEHLVRRDTNLTVETSAVVLSPDYVTEVRWWTHDKFAERPYLDAAEAVALKTLDPQMRVASPLSEKARRIHYRATFRREMSVLFRGEASGFLKVPTLGDALERIRKLEDRIAALEG
jgi:hypothetical protein